jgi:hypothetical protein
MNLGPTHEPDRALAPAFAPTWTARALNEPPLIAPARQFTYPHHVPGEEDALRRGALLVEIKPLIGANFLATCALGFRDEALPTGIFPCPRADDLLALAGGYAYLVDTLNPERCLHLPQRPVTQLLSAPANGLLFLAGFHNVLAVDTHGIRWQTAHLSWEGVTLTGVHDGHLHGTGWNLHTDREVPFAIDLESGLHTGGGFEQSSGEWRVVSG